MKHHTKLALIVASTLAVAAGGSARAEQAPPSPPSEQEGYQGGAEWDRAEGMEKRLEALHKDLKLNASQEAAWTEWSGKMKAARPAWKERHKEFESWANLPVPERMEKMLALAKERVSHLEERLAATKTFYGTLTPEQRQVFDKQFGVGRHGHGGPGKRRPH
jgi:protein CpxP